MLHSFLNSPKINRFVAVAAVGLALVLINRFLFTDSFSLRGIAETLLICISTIYSLFLVNKIGKKSGSKDSHFYFLFLFVCLSGLFPLYYQNLKINLCTTLIINALSKILYLERTPYKPAALLDASLLILCGTLLYNEAIFCLILVVLGVVFFTPERYKNIFIPLVASLVVGVLCLCYAVVFQHFDFFAHLLDFPWDNTLEKLNNPLYFGALAFVGGLGLISLVATFSLGKKKNKKIPEFFYLIWFFSLAGIAIFNRQSPYEALFILPCVASLSICMECIQKKWIKESIFGLCILAFFVRISIPFFI